MSTGKNEIVSIYSHVVSQVIFISTSGIAAGVTLLQTGVIQTNYISLILSFILFTISLILGVFGLTTLLGQADSGNPDIHKGIVRWPNLISMFAFIFGVIFFTYSLSSHFFSGSDLGLGDKPANNVINSAKNTKSDFDCVFDRMNWEQKLLMSYFAAQAFPDLKCRSEQISQNRKESPSRKGIKKQQKNQNK